LKFSTLFDWLADIIVERSLFFGFGAVGKVIHLHFEGAGRRAVDHVFCLEIKPEPRVHIISRLVVSVELGAIAQKFGFLLNSCAIKVLELSKDLHNQYGK